MKSRIRTLAVLAMLVTIMVAPRAALAQPVPPDSLRVLWEAGGDDGAVGTASWYDLRYRSTAPGTDTLAWWQIANRVTGLPRPSLAGTTDSALVRGLAPDRRYYFLIRSYDEEHHPSNFSAMAIASTPCRAPLVAPSSFTAVADSGDVALGWAAAGDPISDSIRIFRRSLPDTNAVLIKSLGTSPRTWRDTTVADHSSYVYSVSWSSRCGIGPSTAPDTVTIGTTTGVLVALFAWRAEREGIELRWRLALPAAEVHLERADDPHGPWIAVETSRREEQGETVTLDLAVVPDRSYHYRLRVVILGRTIEIVGPILAVAGARVGLFTLADPSPNPADGPLRIEYAIPHEAVVEVLVLDLQGRERAVLARGAKAPGRYPVTWNARGGTENAAPGIYFVRFKSERVQIVRRMVLLW